MRSVLTIGLAVLATAVMVLAQPTTGAAQTSKPASEMKPGLAVCYMHEFIRHVNEITGWESNRPCKPGEPLANIDSQVGKGNVLTSNSDDGVIARIKGYIHLEKTGTYRFSFESNDGFRLTINDEMIVEDPEVHSDQFSEIGMMEVETPGWYPIAIDYFERKNTSTLRFFWKPPGTEGSYPIVPAEVLAH